MSKKKREKKYVGLRFRVCDTKSEVLWIKTNNSSIVIRESSPKFRQSVIQLRTRAKQGIFINLSVSFATGCFIKVSQACCSRVTHDCCDAQ